MRRLVGMVYVAFWYVLAASVRISLTRSYMAPDCALPFGFCTIDTLAPWLVVECYSVRKMDEL